MPQQLQVRVSELRDVPHEHRQEHHPPAGRRGPWSKRLLGGGRLGPRLGLPSALLARFWPLPQRLPAFLRSWGQEPRPPAPPPASPERDPCVLSTSSLGEAAGPGVLRTVPRAGNGVGLWGGALSDTALPAVLRVHRRLLLQQLHVWPAQHALLVRQGEHAGEWGRAGGADWGPGRGAGRILCSWVGGWGQGGVTSLAGGSCGAGRALLRQEPPDFGLGFRGHYWGQERGVLG